MQCPQCQHQNHDTVKLCEDGNIVAPYVSPDAGGFLNSPESVFSQWTNMHSQVRLPLLP
jgi:hypothetical protein